MDESDNNNLELIHDSLEALTNRLNLRNQNLNDEIEPITTNHNNSTTTNPITLDIPSSETKLTYYWQVRESDFAPKSKGNNTDIYSCSGLLSNNQYINCANDNCTCFKLTNSALGNHQNPLNFMSSVASRSLNYGQKLVIKEFVNFTLSNGQLHNGCFIVDDTGYGLSQNHLDLYVVNKEAYQWIDGKLNLTSVHIDLDSNCEIKSYVVSSSPQGFNLNRSTLSALLIIWILKLVFIL
ncbi:hypothetical protein CONCODRAFT_5146 [Conidiobolus coronatus NRRL 28638]|uniref:3D domain-containing protein n=1 Tax=Conidiobolus coronatus (strain ATCC 28846 / CBS 209.66 / NRRL 28638) TaxID=796925 RepID=A0A137PAS6_CONC2|nr:hypothetical protein CONCODRAFT_5146 [Conidiobolus coronatus NRRL 28638]|eukprot:KXN72113.1 hypothetical protein CONCODRAFT_5146 [Conidiobolus coronatus NRRL 28638]